MPPQATRGAQDAGHAGPTDVHQPGGCGGRRRGAQRDRARAPVPPRRRRGGRAQAPRPSLRPAAPQEGPARRGGARPSRRLQLRDLQPQRLDDVGRQPHPAGPRRHVRLPGQEPPLRAPGAQQRGPQHPRAGKRGGRPRGQVRPPGRRRHHHPGLRRGAAPAGGRLREPQRHDGQLRRRPRAGRAHLDHGRGDRRRSGGRIARSSASRCGTATCSRCRCGGGRAS